MTVSTHPSLVNKEHRSAFSVRTNNVEPDVSDVAVAEILPVPTKAFSTDSAVEVLEFAIQAVEAGRQVALCTLVEIRGGSSRSWARIWRLPMTGFIAVMSLAAVPKQRLPPKPCRRSRKGMIGSSCWAKGHIFSISSCHAAAG